MLIKELAKLAQLGSARPMSLWLDEYKRLSKNILAQEAELDIQLHQTQVQKNWQKFLNLLKQDNPSELSLAKALNGIANLFDRQNTPEEYYPLLNKFVQEAMAFEFLAQKTQFFSDKRSGLKEKMSDKEQADFDQRLFKVEGMNYCLEYYLALYKKIIDAPTIEEKRKYIESSEVDLGGGAVPGLWADFNQWEVLEKFIYLILDDSSRQQLAEAYFEARQQILKLAVQMTKQGQATVVYHDTSIEEVVSNFKNLILVFLRMFQQKRFDRLASHFFTPYGQNPLISDLRL